MPDSFRSTLVRRRRALAKAFAQQVGLNQVPDGSAPMNLVISCIQVIVGGTLVFLAGILIGSS